MTFSYRNPWSLIVGLILIPAAGFFMFALVAASARGEVEVNGVPGDGKFQWIPAIFAVVAGTPLVVLGLLMLLSYFRERIVWRDGMVSWHDRYGRLRVRSRIEDIYDVVREDTIFAVNEDQGVQVRFGPGPHPTRKRPLEKIVIYTANGDIPYYETAPWAEELEAMAREVVLNKIPKREMGKSWEGG
jgi:hypothetical protein